MRDSRLEDRIDDDVAVEPLEENSHLAHQLPRPWRLKVDALATGRSRDDLHWAIFFLAPPSDANFAHAAATCRKECCVPTKQSVCCEMLVEVLGRVEHHFYYSLNMPVGWH